MRQRVLSLASFASLIVCHSNKWSHLFNGERCNPLFYPSVCWKSGLDLSQRLRTSSLVDEGMKRRLEMSDKA